MNPNNISIKAYDKVAKKYTNRYFTSLSDTPEDDKNEINDFLSTLEKNAKILDLGCGSGNFTNYIHKKGFNIEGIDLSSEMIKLAKQKLPEMTFSIQDMRKTKFKEKSFDALFSAYALIHIPQDQVQLTLNEFNRLLKSKGLLLLLVHNGESDHFEDELLKKGVKNFFNFFSEERLNPLLEIAGFKILSQKVISSIDPTGQNGERMYILAKKII